MKNKVEKDDILHIHNNTKTLIKERRGQERSKEGIETWVEKKSEKESRNCWKKKIYWTHITIPKLIKERRRKR